jgi:hypothetical protein
MAVAWSLLFAAIFWRAGTKVMIVMFLAVFSHWFLDLLSHKPDMQLWPHSSIELGYGPMFGGLGGWLELLVSIAGVSAYVLWARRPQNQSRRCGTVAAIIAAAYIAEVLVVP